MGKEERLRSTLKRGRKEHQFWLERFQGIVKGYREREVEEALIRWVRQVDFECISKEEVDMARELQYFGEDGRIIVRKVKDFLDNI
jgi:G:T-mismatch repair DNA endonuclease (very short patch repair protein)